MITFELAKKLKDNGFPEREQNAGLMDISPDYIPTLSDLLEECGIKFSSLHQVNDDVWQSIGGYSNGYGRKEVRGYSPEEAVANLWLALNTTNT